MILPTRSAFTGRYAHYPRPGRRCNPECPEGDAGRNSTVTVANSAVQRRDQRDDDQHRRDDNRHFKTCQNVLEAQH